jgi:5-methylcytosine-specific restriction endonuclease McrA
MATSRTGTSAWINVRDHAIRTAQQAGQEKCPYCRVKLDYTNKRTANGAWVDHIKPDSKGGSIDLSNLVVCCRTCNTSKGNRAAPKAQQVQSRKPLKTSRRW